MRDERQVFGVSNFAHIVGKARYPGPDHYRQAGQIVELVISQLIRKIFRGPFGGLGRREGSQEEKLVRRPPAEYIARAHIVYEELRQFPDDG